MKHQFPIFILNLNSVRGIARAAILEEVQKRLFALGFNWHDNIILRRPVSVQNTGANSIAVFGCEEHPLAIEAGKGDVPFMTERKSVSYDVSQVETFLQAVTNASTFVRYIDGVKVTTTPTGSTYDFSELKDNVEQESSAFALATFGPGVKL